MHMVHRDESKFQTIARYKNGDPMAIMQGNVGLIGCHPESEKHLPSTLEAFTNLNYQWLCS